MYYQKIPGDIGKKDMICKDNDKYRVCEKNMVISYLGRFFAVKNEWNNNEDNNSNDDVEGIIKLSEVEAFKRLQPEQTDPYGIN